jgi:transcriptional regulator with XRE-family HTH domain
VEPPGGAQREKAGQNRLTALDEVRSHVKRNPVQREPIKQTVGAILRPSRRGPSQLIAFQPVVKRPQTDEPITVALKPLMRERRLTFRALAELTRNHDPDGRGVTFAYLGALTSGREHPSRRSLELIAASLGLEPEYFPEYRLARLRDELNPKRAGFPAAWRRYLELAR